MTQEADRQRAMRDNARDLVRRARAAQEAINDPEPAAGNLHSAASCPWPMEVERLRAELHEIRISFTVAFGMLPSHLHEACVTEIDRQLGRQKAD